MIVAAVEGGGTTSKVAVCRVLLSGDDKQQDSVSAKNTTNNFEILHRTEIDSSGSDPATCLVQCALFLQQHGPYDGLGIATFGPVGIRPDDQKTYGRILQSSPKQQWRNINILTPLRQACGGLNCPVIIDTDVNAPAFSEYQEYNTSCSNNAKSISSCAYVTVGTGVGVGLVVNNETVKGIMHPEGGHVPVVPLENDDKFRGYSWGQRQNSNCPFSGINTVEGLASSVALTERYLQQHQKDQVKTTNAQDTGANILKNLSDEDPVWDHAANALASLCTTLLLTLSMERIVLGGGIMQRNILFPKIRKRTLELLNGYLPLTVTDVERIIVPSPHGNDAGLVGAIRLAVRAAAVNAEKDDESKETIQIKQRAFGYGLWSGIMVGTVSMGLAVKYGFIAFAGSGRRGHGSSNSSRR